jgi:hypothetical protein
MPTLLLLLSPPGVPHAHTALYAPKHSGTYVAGVTRQWLDGKEGFTHARLLELLEFDYAAGQSFKGPWKSLVELRNEALKRGADVVEACMNTVYVYKCHQAYATACEG